MGTGTGALPGVLLGLVAAAGVTWWILGDRPAYQVRQDRDVVDACERYIRNHDSGAGVGAFRDPHVTQLTGTRYRVDGSMNAGNGAEAVRRIDYVCELDHDGDSGRWALVRLELGNKRAFPEG